jgi:hypothetical protein
VRLLRRTSRVDRRGLLLTLPIEHIEQQQFPQAAPLPVGMDGDGADVALIGNKPVTGITEQTAVFPRQRLVMGQRILGQFIPKKAGFGRGGKSQGVYGQDTVQVGKGQGRR